MSSNKNSIIQTVKPHSIKKFELIEMYIKSWAQKLMQNESCNGIIFIDCMCNSGVYFDEAGDLIEGTAVRVSNALLDVAKDYPAKVVNIYLNDINAARIEELKKHIPQDEGNYKVVTSTNDANELLKTIGPQLDGRSHLHYFLLYDPYDASIDWKALLPFFRNWGEVMINHMVSDPIRAITSAKREVTKEKYANTYLADFEKLLPYGTNRDALEARVEEIINAAKGERNYYVAAFPFYNGNNSLLYYLIHCTSNKVGFNLYKKCAWKVFDAQSSSKRTPEYGQLSFTDSGEIVMQVDKNCFHLLDIAQYLFDKYKGMKEVPLESLWKDLEDHPIFPAGGFRPQIKHDLVATYGATISQVFSPQKGKKETLISFP